MNPCVSVIIPAYNAASTIKRAIQSVVDQVGLHEIIVVDDCSSDNTATIIEKLLVQYERLVFIQQQNNNGASVARNAGISAASGRYIAFLDADDVWLPGKLKKQLAVIGSDENIVLVTCDSLQLNADGQILKRAHLNKPPVSGQDSWKTLLAYNFIPTPTVLVKRADIQSVGGFLPELLVAEDLDLWIKIALLGHVAVVKDVFVHYFDYPGSLMKSKGDKIEEIIITMICKHIRQNKIRLSDCEIHNILAVRNFEFGLQKFFNGNGLGSIRYFVKSVKNKYMVFKSIQYIIRSVLYLSPKQSV